MTKIRTIARTLPERGLVVAIADAGSAADAASRISANAQEWASRAGTGADDAAEVTRCAQRARSSAQHAERCDTAAEAWGWARMAWAAVASAMEADARLNAAIAEELAADLLRRPRALR